MIDLFYTATPNGKKITIMLEECGLPYRISYIDILNNEQFASDFLAIAPNNKIPAIIDQEPGNGEAPISVFESGAILIYLAEKAGRFLPTDKRGRKAVLEWLMWQMSGFGPMLGQHGHFLLYAKEKHVYALGRFRDEAARLYGVLDRQLARTGAYVAGAEYTIADMAIFPWAMTHKAQQFTLDDFPHVKRWYATLRARPKLQAGLAVSKPD